MRYQEILEACWTGYRQAGMKKKGDRQVPNCVPVEEVKTGPEMTLNDLLYTAAAKAMHQAGLEGQPMDYEEAIKKAAKIYRIPYTPSELPRLLAQRAEIDRKLAMLKQGKQVAKARRKEKLAPTPAGAEEYWRTHALPTDRIKPPAKTLEETEAELAEDLKKWFKEKWVRFGPDGKIRGACARGSEGEGKPKCLPQAKAHALGKKGRASAAAKKRREDPNPERRGAAKNVATKVREQSLPLPDYSKYPTETLAKMLKQSDCTPAKAMATIRIKNELDRRQQGVAESNNDDWYDDADEFGMPGSEFFQDDDRLRDGDYVRDRQDGEHGEIFRMSGDPSERRVRILDRDGKGWYISPERLVAVDRTDPDIIKYFGKRRQRDMDEAVTLDRNKVPDYPLDPATVKARTDTAKAILSDPRSDADSRKQASAILAGLKQIDEKQDACYRKVKSRYKVWPSAYASGALVQCRKKGAANWGNKTKK